MATSKITKTISDIKFIQNTGTTKFSIDAGAGVDVVLSGYVTMPATPSGYTMLIYGGSANGHAAVTSVGMNNCWVTNTSTVAIGNLTANAWIIAVKYY